MEEKHSNTVKTPWGELAWHLCDVHRAMSYISLTNSVILGGDIITQEFEHTGDNWFYQPVRLQNAEFSASLQYNTEKSIKQATENMDMYVKRHGKAYLFVLVTCTAMEAYIHAKKTKAGACDTVEAIFWHSSPNRAV